jgi:hypothetical protein
MIKLLKFFGKLAAGIIVILFIFTAFTSILLISIESQILSSDFYLGVLEKEDFFDRLPEIAALQIRYSMGYSPCLDDLENCEDNEPSPISGQDGPPSYFQALSQKDWELLLTGLLPADWLKDQVHIITGDLFTTIDSGDGDLKFSIPLLDFKDRLSGGVGVEAITHLLDGYPECSKDDLLGMTRILEGREDPGKDFLTCQPPEDFIKDYTPHLEVIIRRSLKDIPDEIDIGEGLFSTEKDTGLKVFGYQLPTYLFIKWIRWSIRLSPLICVAMLMVIAILAVYSFKSLNVWWGYPVAISGLMGIAISLLAGPLANWLTTTFISGRTMAGMSPLLIETGSSLAVQVIRSLFKPVLYYSLTAAGLGLGIIIISEVIKAPEKKASDQVEEANKEEPEINQTDLVESKETEQEVPEEIKKEPEPEETEQEDQEEIENEPELLEPDPDISDSSAE